MPSDADDALVADIQTKTLALGQLLDDLSQRLRRMRARNREVQEEIASFENDLERLRVWLAEQEADGGSSR